MDPLLLSRIQFAVTIGFHFIFAPLTIGLAWLIAWAVTKYKSTGLDLYRSMARFWIRIFALSFVIGVASGIPMEFQFGTNWAQYSRFVGDIFGAPLAAEGIFAFFLESTLIAVLVFGWDRVSTRALWITSLLLAFGATLSAFFILVANSWQQTPAGYQVIDGRARLTDVWAAIFNPSTLPRILHTIDAAILTGAFFALGMGAILVLKDRQLGWAKESVRLGLVVGLAASVLTPLTGHYHAVQVALTQPEKLAAVEGIFETQTRAPALVFGVPDTEAETVRYQVKIPGLLSLLAFGDIDARVKGLKDFPKDERPPLALTFYPFHLMVVLGMYFVAFTAFGAFLLWKGKLYDSRLFAKLAIVSMPLPFIANELGWITAEVGRQPWAVYRLLRTGDAVSANLPAGQVLFSLIAFCLIYIILFAAWLLAIRRELSQGQEAHFVHQKTEVTA